MGRSRQRQVWRGNTPGRTQYSQKQALGDHINHGQEKNDDGEFVDTMHHPEVDVAGTIGILSSEEISSYLSQGKEFTQ